MNEQPGQNPPPPANLDTAIQPAASAEPAAAPPTPAAPVPPEVINQRLRWADWGLVALLLTLTFLMGLFSVFVHDIWMRLATGRLIANGMYVFGVDPFSGLSAGATWVNHSWLFDWLVYILYSTLGPAAPNILKALLGVGIAWTLLQIRQRDQPLFLPAVVATAAVMIASMRFLLRPEIVSYLFLAITFCLLLKRDTSAADGTTAAESSPALFHGSVRHLWLLPPLWLLWVNLDNWFILGPITAGLYLLGVVIARFAGQPTSTPPRTLGLVLVVGLLACLVNPHHVGAFVLPTELAYLLHGLPLPSWVTAAGETVVVLQNAGPQFVWLESPLSGEYFTRFGLTICGFVFYPYYLLAVGSFVLPFVGKGAGTQWSWPRFLVFAFFAVLTLFFDQFVPFFAIIAAPCIVLNLQNYLARVDVALVADLQQRIIMRVVVGVLLVLFLFATWPGWLHTPRAGFRMERRVSWDFHPSASLKKAAEQLRELVRKGEKGEKGVALNLNRDFPYYLAWFSADDNGQPLVKGGVDHRYALFADTARDFGRIRQGLFALTSRTAPAFQRDWQKFVKEYQVDHLVITGLETSEESFRTLAFRDLWPDYRTWPVHYLDGRCVVFAARPADRSESRVEYFNELAYGAVPPTQRPPAQGMLPPKTAPGFWENYLHGTGERPVAADTAADYDMHRSHIAGQSGLVRWLGVWVTNVTGADVPGQLAMPFVVNTFVDFGPSSAVILEMRASRQAVHDNPFSLPAQRVLRQACDRITSQEESWASQMARPQSPLFRTLRQEMRLIQTITVLHTINRISPEYHGAYLDLFNLYKQNYYLDLAYDNLVKAQEALKSADIDPQQRMQQSRAISAELQLFEQALKKRRGDLLLRGDKADPFAKAVIALKQRYSFADDRNQEYVEPSMGLAKDALELLQAADLRKLNPVDKANAAQWQIELLLKTGEVHQVRELVEDPQEARQLAAVLGPRFLEWRALAALAIGDYATAEKSLNEALNIPQLHMIPVATEVANAVQFTDPNATPFSAPLATTLRYRSPLYAVTMQKFADWQLLRGLTALEAGDTRLAADCFRRVIDSVRGNVYYPDLPVAEAYSKSLEAARAR